MIINDIALENFKIEDTDSDEVKMLKRFYLNNDKVSRQVLADEEAARQKKFDKDYNRVMKINTIEDLKLQLMAVEELLNQ